MPREKLSQTLKHVRRVNGRRGFFKLPSLKNMTLLIKKAKTVLNAQGVASESHFK